MNAAAGRENDELLRYDLEKLVEAARSEKAYDEAVKVRVTQEDIQKLIERRRKAKP